MQFYVWLPSSRAVRATTLLLMLICAPVLRAQEHIPTKAFVVNVLDSTVSEVDLRTMAELRSVNVGARPYYPAVSADGSTLAVTVEGEGVLRFFDTKTMSRKGEIAVGKMYSEHLLTLPDGRTAILANRFANQVLIIDMLAMKTVGTIEVSSPHNIRIGASGKYAYVMSKLDPALSVVDIAARKVLRRFPLKLVPRGLTVSSDERTIWFGANWINAVFAMDAATGKILYAIPIPAPATAPALQENTYHGLEFLDDHTLLAANEGNSTLDVIDTRTGSWVARYTDVARPAAMLRIPGTASEILFSNKADNSVVRASIDNQYHLTVLARGVVGHGEDLFAKRFIFFN